MSSVPIELETASFSLLEEDILADSEDFAELDDFTDPEDFADSEDSTAPEDSAGSSTGDSAGPAELPSKAVSLEFDTGAISEEEELSQPSQTGNSESPSRGATLM